MCLGKDRFDFTEKANYGAISNATYVEKNVAFDLLSGAVVSFFGNMYYATFNNSSCWLLLESYIKSL